MVVFSMMRARVRPECEAEFLRASDDPGGEVTSGLRCMSLVRTEEHCYCFVGEWDSLDALTAARPVLGAWLDSLRPLLDEAGEPEEIAGQVVARLKPRIAKGDWQSC